MCFPEVVLWNYCLVCVVCVQTSTTYKKKSRSESSALGSLWMFWPTSCANLWAYWNQTTICMGYWNMKTMTKCLLLSLNWTFTKNTILQKKLVGVLYLANKNNAERVFCTLLSITKAQLCYWCLPIIQLKQLSDSIYEI